MEGGDGGRQQVVVMHRATFLATQNSNKGLTATFTTQGIERGLGGHKGALVHRPVRKTVPVSLYVKMSLMSVWSCLSMKSQAPFWDFSATHWQ